jgi:hypothetical protein
MSTSTDQQAAPEGPPPRPAAPVPRITEFEKTPAIENTGWARSTAVPVAAVLTFGLGSLYLARAVVAGPTHPVDEGVSVRWLGLDQWEFLAWPIPALFVGLAVAAGLVAAHPGGAGTRCSRCARC